MWDKASYEGTLLQGGMEMLPHLDMMLPQTAIIVKFHGICHQQLAMQPINYLSSKK